VLLSSEVGDLQLVRDRFQALADPIRLAVVELLRGEEMCVCDLCDRLHLHQSKLSFHLKILKQAGLIRPRQAGRWIYYRLDPEAIAHLSAYLAQFQTQPYQPARPCPD